METNLITTLTNLNIWTPEFWEFMQGKIKVLDDIELTWYGVFPIVSADGILQDIRMLVPSFDEDKEIKTLINIHEFTHAFELFQELGSPYISDTEKREERAQTKEREYQGLTRKLNLKNQF